MAVGQTNGAILGSDGKCKGGQTSAAGFPVIGTSVQTVTGSRRRGSHRSAHGSRLGTGGLEPHLAVVQRGDKEESSTVEVGPGLDHGGEGGYLHVYSARGATGSHPGNTGSGGQHNSIGSGD